MRNISDTVSRLAALRRMSQSVGRAVPTDTSRLSRLEGFGSNPGALAAWCHVPDGLPRGAPLVVVLHGCTQTAAGYDAAAGWSKLADHYRFALLFPEQQRANNPNLCFNWFVPDDCRRDSGEALSIRQMIDAVVERDAIDPARVYINGLSAGGAMTSVMLATYPEVFAGGAIIAGLPYDCARTIPEAFDRMRGHGGPSRTELQKSLREASSHKGPWPTISVWQGTGDRTVAPSNADAIVTQWLGLHGFSDKPSIETHHGNYERRAWNKAGRVMIEDYRITGMGHGTPITTGDRIGDGNTAPFMIDVGISSTRMLASTWGLVESAAVSPMGSSAKVATSQRPGDGRNNAAPEPASPGGVRAIIENALRAAGLMQ